jgi:hypothetical protein
MENNLSSNYISRLTYYTPRSALFFSILQLLLFKKAKTGILFGLALGAGYCHQNLVKALGKIYNRKVIEL